MGKHDHHNRIALIKMARPMPYEERLNACEQVLGKRVDVDQLDEVEALKVRHYLDDLKASTQETEDNDLTHGVTDREVLVGRVEDDGEVVPASAPDAIQIAELKARAMYVDAQIKRSAIDLYIHLHEMVDRELWQFLGYDNQAHYLSVLGQTLQISKTQIYTYAQIGREIKPHALLTDGTVKDGVADALAVGSEKLLHIVRHAAGEVRRLIDEGHILVGDEELDVDRIKRTGKNELAKQLRELTGKAARSAELEALLKLKEKENEDLIAEVRQLRPLQERYATDAEALAAINSATALITDATKIFAKLDLDALSEDTRLQAGRMLNLMWDNMQGVRDRHVHVFDQLLREDLR